MILTQEIVDWAKSKHYKMRTQALYESRKANEVFLHPNTGHRMVFSQIIGMGSVRFLTHDDVRKHMKGDK